MLSAGLGPSHLTFVSFSLKIFLCYFFCNFIPLLFLNFLVSSKTTSLFLIFMPGSLRGISGQRRVRKEGLHSATLTMETSGGSVDFIMLIDALRVMFLLNQKNGESTGVRPDSYLIIGACARQDVLKLGTLGASMVRFSCMLSARLQRGGGGREQGPEKSDMLGE